MLKGRASEFAAPRPFKSRQLSLEKKLTAKSLRCQLFFPVISWKNSMFIELILWAVAAVSAAVAVAHTDLVGHRRIQSSVTTEMRNRSLGGRS
jgi:hypothetical protein